MDGALAVGAVAVGEDPPDLLEGGGVDVALGDPHRPLRDLGHGGQGAVEPDRRPQAVARGAKVERIYHTSSGAPATPTVTGTYEFYMAQPGYNAKEMYFSQYFSGGYAIHGYKSVPVYPASHGCLRVPLDDAVSIFNWIQIGDRIDVYA